MGCSLALVCRYMRSAVEPVRYESVALRGPKKIFSFMDVLRRTKSPPRTRHLLLSVLGAPYMHCRSETQAFMGLSEDEKSEASQAFVTILTQMAPTLFTLFLYDSQFLIDTINTPFPVLEDLSTPLPLWMSSDFATKDCFPSLKRLHVSNIQPMDVSDFWEALASSTPSLTHLRLSGVGQDPHLHKFIKIFLRLPGKKSTPSRDLIAATTQSAEDDEYGEGSAEAEEIAGISARLPNLKNIYVRPRINTSIDWSSAGRRAQAAMMRGLREVARDIERGEGVERLCLLPETGGYGLLEARSHWLDVIEGGDGPWSSQPDPTSAWAEAGLRLRLRDLSIF